METEQIQETEDLLTQPGVGDTPESEVEETAAEQETPVVHEEEDADVREIIKDMGLDPDRKGQLSKRVKQLVGRTKTAEEKARDAEEEAANWRAETLRLAMEREKPQVKPEELQVDISDLPLPKLENFDFDEDNYRAALVERAAIVALRKERARDQQREAISRQSEEERKLASWQNEGRAKYADFDVALAGNVRVTDQMKIAIMGNERGHDVAYFIGKNPNEAMRIASLHPIEQTVEINKLAKKLANQKRPKTESTAPSATSPVGDREVVAKEVNIYDPNISFKDYERIRMKQERERAGLS